jgi:hypothetical protein
MMTTEIELNDNEAVEVTRETMHLRRTGSHGASQPSPLASLKTPAGSASFEAAQMLLQRAGEQLRVPDQEREKSKDSVAAIVERVLLDACQKFNQWGIPINERMTKELESMDSKWLSKMTFKLFLTPQDLAVRYLAWLHASLGTEEPNPLEGWLRELESHILHRYPDRRPLYLFRAAERQVFIWVGLYVSALLGWIEEFCAAVPLVEITAASIRFGVGRSDLNRQLVEQRNRLLEAAAVIQIIEGDYLVAPILPDAWRRWLEPVELDSVIAKFPERAGGPAVVKACDPADCKKRASVKVAALLETARATADITSCNQLIMSVTRAQLTLTNRREDWKKLSALLESGEAERERRKPAQSSPSVSPPARPKSPSGAPKRKTNKQLSAR